MAKRKNGLWIHAEDTRMVTSERYTMFQGQKMEGKFAYEIESIGGGFSLWQVVS